RAPARGSQLSDLGELWFGCGWRVGQIGAAGNKQKKVVVIAQVKANHRDWLVVPPQNRAAVAGELFQGSGQHVISIGPLRCQIPADFTEIGRRDFHGVASLRSADHPALKGGETPVLTRLRPEK